MPVGTHCRRPARTINPGLSVRVAAEWMDKQRVGALVVVDGARPVGLVTDRDIALRVVADGRDPDATTVGALFGAPPITLAEDASILEASAQLRRNGMRRMPVVDASGNLVGMLTVDDLVRLVSQELGALADVASEQVPTSRAPARAAVRNVAHYAKTVVTVETENCARDVAQRLQTESVGCVVVVDDDGAPLGIITDRDLTRRVVAKGLDPAVATAASIMSARLLTVDADEPLQRVAQLMSDDGVRRIPVVQKGRLTGIVTYDDVLVALGRELHDLGEAARGGIGREHRSTRAEHARIEVERAVESLEGWLEALEDEARGTLDRQLDALRQRLLGSN